MIRIINILKFIWVISNGLRLLEKTGNILLMFSIAGLKISDVSFFLKDELRISTVGQKKFD